MKNLKYLLVLLISFITPGLLYAPVINVQVSPPRFEYKTKAGAKIKDILEIYNPSTTIGTYDIRTADWDITDKGDLTVFPPPLQPSSCRPWVGIERKSIKLNPDARKRFRFEVNVPPSVPDGECRFAILITPSDDSAKKNKQATAAPPNRTSLAIQFQGRLAILVYITIGNATAKLEFKEMFTQDSKGNKLPYVKLYNSGNTHGRPLGELKGKDAAGKDVLFSVAELPILPKKTRAIPLTQLNSQGAATSYSFKLPLTLKGTIEWDGGKLDVSSNITK